LCRKFTVIKDSVARAAILSIVGDLHEAHPTFAPQMLRFLATNLANETADVRLQALTLAAKLIATGTESQVPSHVLKLCRSDPEFDVRNRARFYTALIETPNDFVKANLKRRLFPPERPSNGTDLQPEAAEYQIGTLSHMFDGRLEDMNRCLTGQKSRNCHRRAFVTSRGRVTRFRS
jgi:AP-3 complex subunit beta